MFLNNFSDYWVRKRYPQSLYIGKIQGPQEGKQGADLSVGETPAHILGAASVREVLRDISAENRQLPGRIHSQPESQQHIGRVGQGLYELREAQ